LAAAKSLVAEKGYAATSIEAVAERAGVGKTTIYRWWPSKSDLFTEVYGVLVAPEKLMMDSGTLKEDMQHLFKALFKIYRQAVAPVILAGLISDAQHNDDARRTLKGGIVIGRRDLLAVPLKRALERGEVSKDVDIDFIVDLIVGAIWHKILTKPKQFNAHFQENLCNMVLKMGNVS
jgi:AcrR family transcriptional regulator